VVSAPLKRRRLPADALWKQETSKPGAGGPRFLMRSLTTIAAVIAALILLPLGVGLGVTDHRRTQNAVDRKLTAGAEETSRTMRSKFEELRTTVLLLGENSAFRRTYAASTPVARASARRDVDRALSYLPQLYPGAISEICFIDRGGGENARVVRDRLAPVAELSPDERANPFFRPAFATPYGGAYIAAPYLSPDTSGWVLGAAAPIHTLDRSKPAIVHFELTLESVRRSLPDTSGSAELYVVDRRTGSIVLEQDHAPSSKAALGAGADHRFTALTRASRPSGLRTVGGRRAAFSRLPTVAGNANDWLVVAVARGSGAGPLAGVPLAAFILVGVALLLVMLTFIVRSRAERELEREALTDSLTGLGNRRALVGELPNRIGEARSLLVILDLDGFKTYNDTFGHPAGDALLRRLAQRLSASLPAAACAYRIGGDEFCVLSPLGALTRGDVERIATLAMVEQGDGFSVSCSFGSVVVPDEARTGEDALRTADRRMYAHKHDRRLSPAHQSVAVLLRAVGECHPELGEHVSDVVDLAVAVGEQLEMGPGELAVLRNAAALHDVGKLAVPHEILMKPAALDPAETEFIRRHTLIGERIVAAAPALEHVAPIVRASHERWDGAGYPDGLAGEAIPMAARVVFACDALGAMIQNRPYAPGRTVEQGITELRRCSGTQFDPAVVAALVAVVSRPDGRDILTGRRSGSPQDA
jgi:diguanylate cyclase (GGDEF)-like protein